MRECTALGLLGLVVGGVFADTPSLNERAQLSFTSTAISEQAGYLLSDQRLHDDPKILWDGLLTGLRGFEHFHEPVGAPFYFETPFNETHAKFVYLHHDFPAGGPLNNGNLDVFALQVRIALTERLALIATQDGYSILEPAEGAPDSEGWNDIALGLKYTFVADEESDFLFAAGMRYKLNSGDSDVLQGDVQELSPFISVAKGWDKLHFVGNVTYRAPFDSNDGNHVLQWHTHLDYELFDGVAPMVELHGLHYLSNGDRTPLSVGGLDYTNLGSTDVKGSSVVWIGVGASIKLSPHIELGAVYEHTLTNENSDIFDSRVTAAVTINW